ncbi:uncharacterized protein [Nicotiana tomentosiformis]|uniref:uncharacterized protein n=1 Tax=Nicotiana tomentosiformis TaxID=4098 RepID=UPI00388C4491
MATYEALYGRRWCSLIGWFEPGKARLLGTDLVRDALENVKLIQEQLHTIHFRQKSYADWKARDVAYMVGQTLFLRVTPMKGVMRFGKKDKLSPSMVQLDGAFTYDVESMAILDRQVRKLRSKIIAPMKVH